MASIYRPTYKKGGKTLKVKKWYIRYRDHDGRLTTVPGFTDKGATQQLAAKLEREADMIRRGLLAPAAKFQGDSIDQHLAAFEASLRAKQVSDGQVALVLARCRKLIEVGKVRRLVDIRAERVSETLAELRQSTKERKGLSVQTSNHYLRAIKQLTRWLWLEKRLSEDPLVRLEMLNVQVDRRHDRRALSDDEMTRLLAAAKSGADYLGFTGRDRRMLYLMASATGLRASELASLSPSSVDLDGTTPRVVVEAGYSKRRRQDEVPLSSDLVAELRPWLAEKPLGVPLWPGQWAKVRIAGKLMQFDLEAAKIVYRDASGRFADFHALRHTFITNLGRHGVSLTTAQKLARHSTPVLTAARYTHIDLAEQKKAVDLVSLRRPLQRAEGISCHNGSSEVTTAADSEEEPEKEKTLKNRRFQGQKERRGRDSNPGDPCGSAGFQDRCNRPLCHLSGVSALGMILVDSP